MPATPVNSFRSLLESEKPLVLPGAHDALSARLIERAGFKAYFIGGFGLIGARYALPDIGLMGLGEISAGVRDIVAATSLPVLVDGDNGYGDVKNIVHVLNHYENLGASAIFFEDQVSPKRCGHMAGKQLLSSADMEARLRAASQNKRFADTFIIARTDAREVHGLDEALRRGERYLRAGADGLFIEAPIDLKELRTIAEAFDVPQMANMLEGGRTPLLRPAELGEMGFRIAIYGISPLVHAIAQMQKVLADLHRGDIGFSGKGIAFDELKDLLGLARWADIEGRYPVE